MFGDFKELKDQNPDLINIGKKWSKQEEKKLLTELSKGNNIKDLTRIFGRTEGGLICHLKKMAMYMIEDGKDIDEVSDITKLPKIAITNYINKQNPKIAITNYINKQNPKMEIKMEIKISVNSEEFFDWGIYVKKLWC